MLSNRIRVGLSAVSVSRQVQDIVARGPGRLPEFFI